MQPLCLTVAQEVAAIQLLQNAMLFVTREEAQATLNKLLVILAPLPENTTSVEEENHLAQLCKEYALLLIRDHKELEYHGVIFDATFAWAAQWATPHVEDAYCVHCVDARAKALLCGLTDSECEELAETHWADKTAEFNQYYKDVDAFMVKLRRLGLSRADLDRHIANQQLGR